MGAEYNYWDDLMGDDDVAGQYMVSYGEGPGSATRMMFAHFIEDGESVLDVGCGPGWNMDHFAQFGPALSAYKGVDYSIRMVRAANARLSQKLDANFTTMQIQPFELQDCRELKEDAGSHDVVIIQDCVEHTNGYETPVLEALRVARKRVIVTFWHLTENDDHINDDGKDGYGAWYSKPKWEAFLDDIGFAWTATETAEGANRHHDYYIIDKDEPR